ncbi:MAG: hypothetical protein K0S65_1833, partial [Labilithrix sp.]|nr:hypothetical protein [Labilithrix sp.]
MWLVVLDSEAAAVRLDGEAAEGQPEAVTDAARTPRVLASGMIMSLEEPLPQLRRDAWPEVGHGDLDRVLVSGVSF